ncbi:MAG: hypothetical protein JWM67_23 [Mycobacterium sp.]|jgi:hypothetical protein|nr:hypothetical protein [Mycobacterium sp.]
MARLSPVVVELPGPETRWRCGACGNLTRFDVTRSTRAREYLHADLAGEVAVEERQVLSDVVEHVVCRWCSGTDTVVLERRPIAGS